MIIKKYKSSQFSQRFIRVIHNIIIGGVLWIKPIAFKYSLIKEIIGFWCIYELPSAQKMNLENSIFGNH